MSLVLLVYVIGILEPLSTAIGLFLLVTIFLLVISAAAVLLLTELVYYDTEEEKARKVADKKTYYKYIKRLTIASCLLSIISVMIPSEKVATTMVAAYATQKIAQDPKVQQLSEKVLKVIEKKLDSYITETK